MADYFTSFAWRLDVGAPQNVARAIEIAAELEDELNDSDRPSLGFEVGPDEKRPGVVHICDGDGLGEPEHVIAFVRHCAQVFGLTGRWGFGWGLWCTSSRTDGFGGGRACARPCDGRYRRLDGLRPAVGRAAGSHDGPERGRGPGLTEVPRACWASTHAARASAGVVVGAGAGRAPRRSGRACWSAGRGEPAMDWTLRPLFGASRATLTGRRAERLRRPLTRLPRRPPGTVQRRGAQLPSRTSAPATPSRITSMSSLLTGDLSHFETLCAAAQDPRPHPEQAALEQFGQAMMTEHLDLLCGTALEDHLPTFAEGLIGAFQSIALRLQREHDRAGDDVKRLVRDFAGGEIEDVELQEATAKAHAAQAALRAAEFMRDAASHTYTSVTGEVWSPWRGGTKTLASTAAHLDARDALRTKRAGDHARTNPGDQVVAFRASPQADTQEDAGRIFDALNWALTQWPSMKLATTGAKGAEKIAIKWARQKSVDVILARVDFNRHGKAAPFRANDELVALEPVCVLSLATTLNPERAATVPPFGPALNAGQAAEAKGCRHLPLRLRKAA